LLSGATLDVTADVTLNSAFEISAGRQEGVFKLTLAGPVT
jgi:hypothetical protein